MLRCFHVAHLPCVFELRACRFRAYRRGVVLVGVEGRIEIDEVDYLVVESSEDIEVVAGEDGRRLDVRTTSPLLRRCFAAIVPSLLPLYRHYYLPLSRLKLTSGMLEHWTRQVVMRWMFVGVEHSIDSGVDCYEFLQRVFVCGLDDFRRYRVLPCGLRIAIGARHHVA